MYRNITKEILIAKDKEEKKKMKSRKSKLFVVLTTIFVLMFMQMSFIISEVKADVITGSEGDVSWSFDNQSGILTFSGSGSISEAWKDDISFYPVNVESIVIQSGITSIDDYAFHSCHNLTNITVENSNLNYKDIDGVLFDKDGTTLIKYPSRKETESYVIPNSVISIGNSAFSFSDNLTNIEIPNSVTHIGNEVFMFCESLTNIEIPNSVTSIGNSAFSNCTTLTNIEIPNSVTSIEPYAFYSCKSLTNIEIPNSVTNIGVNVFTFCDNLTKITVENSNSYYKDIDGVLFNKKGTILIKYPCRKKAESYVIPNSVISIEMYAFNNCSSLISIIIPNSVIIIGDSAFNNCTSLTNIEIPNSVTSIGDYSFAGCTSLTNIEIPNNVTRIGEDAFICCDNLTIYTTSNSYAKTYAEDNKIPYIVEDTAPTIEVTYKDGTITVTATDEGVGLANEAYSLDNKEWSASNEFSVDKSGKYTVYARDKLGNIATKEIDIIIEEKDVVDEEKNEEKDIVNEEKNEIEDNKTTNNEDNKSNIEENKNEKPNNQKDGSESPEPFGQYGNKTFIVLLLIVTILVLSIIYKKYKKYNLKY